jgi:protocatechuate 4,5-dioxygenase, alpha chain
MGRAVREIPDTSIFDLRLSRKGMRLNRMCFSLCAPSNRDAFKADEERYMSQFGLNETEKSLVRARDFKGLIEAGTNIYALLKIGSATGHSLYRMGAQMRGETFEQFLSTRNFRNAV